MQDIVQTATNTIINSQQPQHSASSPPTVLSSSLASSTSGSIASAATAIKQLSTISLMLEYDIDNTLNTIKENSVHLMTKQDQITKTTTKQLVNNNSRRSSQKLKKFLSLNSSTASTEGDGEAEDEDEDETEAEAEAEIDELEVDEGSKDANGNDNLISQTPPVTPILKNVARKRWHILAKALRKDSDETVSSTEECSEEQTVSVRRFKSFDLLRQDSFDDHSTLNTLGKPEYWYKYRVILENIGKQEFSVNIHHVERQFSATDLMGFNNTGNICVWPSEEALTAYVLSDLETYRGKWILELGGGFTCLSGLMLSKYAKPFAVHLTDGNVTSVENVKKTVCLNGLSCYTKCSVLKWEDVEARSRAEAGKFDVILSADCLFFDDARSALVDTIWYFLSSKGTALVMAPKRGHTMELFIKECQLNGFNVVMKLNYNDTIWKRHLELQTSDLYVEDLHYPVLLLLTKHPVPAPVPENELN